MTCYTESTFHLKFFKFDARNLLGGRRKLSPRKKTLISEVPKRRPASKKNYVFFLNLSRGFFRTVSSVTVVHFHQTIHLKKPPFSNLPEIQIVAKGIKQMKLQDLPCMEKKKPGVLKLRIGVNCLKQKT